ncbi:type II toxin-antitoxin system RelE/ParE family toxin [Mariniradius sediminis]|uniref:Type II toxin-antitoxin system RelE/ParE family toxin n=1 Tax=Mariniradius sediminis TaxID=2909237 RepID=A0ABS9BRY9_9BACT|nr:type II toxin-antitoxin system RelE/ParE family toxin [Mariniradius sediminis]MCF1750554.1 type II toxin-antitoxin system RelE/ParE family toxin [Mariniradius sediminis]
MQIFWSDLAKANLREIRAFYQIVANSKVAKSIVSKIIDKTRLLRDQPEMGQLEDNPLVVERNFRYLVEGNYKIVYKVYLEDQTILIATIFDTRQNPKKLKI